MKMQNKDIHKGLQYEEIRNYIASRQPCTDINDPNITWLINHAKEQIQKLEADIAKWYEQISVGCMMKVSNPNWKEYDVSDETYGWRESGLSFIGTEEEYNELMKQIKGE